MLRLPLPSIAQARHPRTRQIYRLARSKPARCLLVFLVTVSVLLGLRTYLGDRNDRDGVASWDRLEAWVLDQLKAKALAGEPLTYPDLDANRTFHLGNVSRLRYKEELVQFVTRTFPKKLRKRALASIELYLGDSTNIATGHRIPQKIYQTAKREPYWTSILRSWQNIPGYEYHFFDDPKADRWIRRVFGGTEIELIWDKLGAGIKRADMLRYLLVMVEGGIYSDMDTVRLKSISQWGKGADFSGPRTTTFPSVIVGIEADVGDQKDWHKWWPRPLQIAQWTFGGAPMHPILIDTVRRVHETTALIVATETTLKASQKIEYDSLHGRRSRNITDISVMEWTGPSVFTDSTMRYLVARHAAVWTTLKGLNRPLRIGDIVVLPVTGFSPGVGLFGAGDPTDSEAMVHHMFAGSWKRVQT